MMTSLRPEPVLRSERTSASPSNALADVQEASRMKNEPSHHTDKVPLSLPPQELSRVTDHVIRQLDRRVLSYRERTGEL